MTKRIERGRPGYLFVILDGYGKISRKRGDILKKKFSPYFSEVETLSSLENFPPRSQATILLSDGILSSGKMESLLNKRFAEELDFSNSIILTKPFELLQRVQQATDQICFDPYVLTPCKPKVSSSAAVAARFEESTKPRALRYACQYPTTLEMATWNSKLIDCFEELLEFHKSCPMAKNSYFSPSSEIALMRVLSVLRRWSKPITSGDEVVREMYMGDKWATTIDEILKRGTCERLDILKRSKQFVACKELCKIHGIGRKRALQLFQNGYSSVEQLRDAVLNERAPAKNIGQNVEETLRTGLEHFDDMKRMFSLEDRLTVGGKIKVLLEPLGLKMMVCGGTRRRKPNGHDLDIIVTGKDATTSFDVWRVQKEVMKVLNKNFCVALLSQGKPSFANSGGIAWGEDHAVSLFIVKDGSACGRRVDIVVVPPDHWVYAILGWTGTTFFERNLRTYVAHEFKLNCVNHQASGPGERWQLTQKGLARVIHPARGETPIVQERKFVESEEELFEFLGLKYLEPWEREM